MSISDYESMLERQGGVCAICMAPHDEVRMCVDHCHDTGRVRGLLCSGCNSAIGLFKESESAMASAIEYLRSHANNFQENEK